MKKPRKYYNLAVQIDSSGVLSFPNIKEGYIRMDIRNTCIIESEAVESAMLPWRAKKVDSIYFGIVDFWIYNPNDWI